MKSSLIIKYMYYYMRIDPSLQPFFCPSPRVLSPFRGGGGGGGLRTSLTQIAMLAGDLYYW